MDKKEAEHLIGNSSPGAVKRWYEMLNILHDAASLINAKPWVVKILEMPQRVFEAAIPVRMDDGEIEVLPDGEYITILLVDLQKVAYVSIWKLML